MIAGLTAICRVMILPVTLMQVRNTYRMTVSISQPAAAAAAATAAAAAAEKGCKSNWHGAASSASNGAAERVVRNRKSGKLL